MKEPRSNQIFSAFNWIITAVIVIVVICVTSCSKPRIVEQQAAQVIKEVITSSTNIPGNDLPLYPAPDSNASELPWQVTVDTSVSMAGYLSTPQTENTRYRQVLDHFNTRLGARFDWAGQQNGEITPTNPMDYKSSEYYNKKTVDYSEVFKTFAADTSCNHVFVTDGVFIKDRQFLNPHDLSQMLKAWLDNGGQFALVALRSQYWGVLTSGWNLEHKPMNAGPDDLAVSIDNTNRPFLMWFFVQPGQSLDMSKAWLDKILQTLASDDANSPGMDPAGNDWQTLLIQGHSGAHLELSRSGLPSGDAPANDINKITGLVPNGYGPVGEGDVYYPLDTPVRFNFDYKLSSDTGSEPSVSLRSWEVQLGPSNEVNLINLVGLPANPMWRPLTNAATGGFGCRSSTAPVSTNGSAVTGPKAIRLELTQTRPNLSSTNQDLVVWLLTLKSSPSADLRQVWDDLSTDNDSQPENGNRIYRLNEYLQVLEDQSLVDDRLVYFTYWPK